MNSLGTRVKLRVLDHLMVDSFSSPGKEMFRKYMYFVLFFAHHTILMYRPLTKTQKMLKIM